MEKEHWRRLVVLAALLGIGSVWMLLTADSQAGVPDYPEAGYIATAEWLMQHKDDSGVLIVDVRQIEGKKTEEGRAVFIPGAVNLPWKKFRYHDAIRGVADAFVGIERAREVLGQYGVARTDTVVLYDSGQEDGGATASYIFWILDMLGHEKIRILDGGIDAWVQAGGRTVSEPRKPEAIEYHAPSTALRIRALQDGDFIAKRLGDPHYQIIDVRSEEEYLGQKPNMGLDGSVLKLGHIPGAVNIDYRLNWVNTETKQFLSYPALLNLYKGLDPEKAVVVYCHSGRRSSFTYFILRVMGFSDVILYDKSWNEWGSHSFYYPAEQRTHTPEAESLPTVSGGGKVRKNVQVQENAGQRELEPVKGGYISCGG